MNSRQKRLICRLFIVAIIKNTYFRKKINIFSFVLIKNIFTLNLLNLHLFLNYSPYIKI